MRLLSGEIDPDHGSISVRPKMKVARLVQDVPKDIQGTVRDVVLEAQRVDPSTYATENDRWEVEHAVDRTLSQMELDPKLDFANLSSGMKRRVLLASAIAGSPDILLLDEPTNHLDIPSILWLERFLKSWAGTILFVTHDRSFLQQLATRIWEIDRGRLFDWSCDYATFLKRKEQTLAAEEKQNALFDKKLAQGRGLDTTGYQGKKDTQRGGESKP